jgi:hypothetical protein
LPNFCTKEFNFEAKTVLVFVLFKILFEDKINYSKMLKLLW